MERLGIAQSTRRRFLQQGLLVASAAGTGTGGPAWGGENDAPEHVVTRYGARADGSAKSTAAIQAAINACAAQGGGVVRLPRGRFLSGAVQLRDRIRLLLDEGAVLLGSDDWRDYGEGRWLDALLSGRDLADVTIEGPGRIDGADCRNPKGEEGFRGPHAIFLANCRNVAVRNLTIERAGNYALLYRDCADAEIRGAAFRGGHDGVHAQACARFRVAECDFRTGDDCLAGCDNVDFTVRGCKINSSCNGFRLGCRGLWVKDCRFWGPGEFRHQVSDRTNMLSAFVHFAPKDRNPQLPSDDWLIEDVTIENVDAVYGYDFERGLWQTGQPALRLVFRNVQATEVARPIRVLGDADRRFDLTLDRVAIELREDRRDQEVLNCRRFGAVRLRNVTLHNSGRQPIVRASEGNLLWLDRVTWVPENATPLHHEQVESVRTDRMPD